MRRTVSAIFTVAIAMLLSVSLAVPASAADLWKDSTDPKFKYGLDYWKFMTGGGGGTPAGPVSPVKQPVAPSVNPSNTGGSWYLQNQKDKAAGTRTVAPQPGGKVLTGKIIEPGKTIVRAPSTYAPSPKYLGKIIGGSLLGGVATLGMGGVAPAPSNWKEIAAAQGVSGGCLDGSVQCTPDEIKKQFTINSCGITATCKTIGAKDAGGGDFGEWFKTDALPFLEDLWKQITGQKEATDWPEPNGHTTITNSRGCTRDFTLLRFDDDNKNFTIVNNESIIVRPRPVVQSPTVDSTRWDADCGPNVVNKMSTLGGSNWDTVCVNPTTGKTTGTNGSPLGKSFSFVAPTWDDATWRPNANNIGGLCNYNNDPAAVIFSVQFRFTTTQAQWDGSPAMYENLRYSNHYNPNPLLADTDTTEDTKITTTADCRTTDGQVFTLTQTIEKTAAMAAPQCPIGSDLIRHDVKSTNGATTNTLDSGGEVPGSKEKYPGCFAGPGCTMEVHLDGSPCVATKAECQNWPAVAAQTPSRVQCKWGTYVVPTTDCNVLSNAYKTETGVVFDPRSGTWVAIDTHGNPVAPNPEPWNPTNPNPVAGAAPGTATPGTGSSATPMPTTGTAPGSQTNVDCATRPWSWNPSDWVETPVICALKVAFVPQTSVQARMTEIQTLALDRPPMNWLFPPPMTGPGGGGCPNWVVSLPGFEKNVVCGESFTAAIVGARGPLFGLVATAMVWPLMRSLWYAAIPILRVSPGGSK